MSTQNVSELPRHQNAQETANLQVTIPTSTLYPADRKIIDYTSNFTFLETLSPRNFIAQPTKPEDCLEIDNLKNIISKFVERSNEEEINIKNYFLNTTN